MVKTSRSIIPPQIEGGSVSKMARACVLFHAVERSEAGSTLSEVAPPRRRIGKANRFSFQIINSFVIRRLPGMICTGSGKYNSFSFSNIHWYCTIISAQIYVYRLTNLCREYPGVLRIQVHKVKHLRRPHDAAPGCIWSCQIVPRTSTLLPLIRMNDLSC